MKLYNHQKELLKDNPLKCLLAYGAGSGKTVCAIKLIDQNDIKNCLVVTPKVLESNLKMK